MRSLMLASLVIAGALFAACEKPDASAQTSPSAKAMIGTTTGNVAFAPPDAPPADVPAPSGWDHRLEAVFFDELEDGSPSIRVVLQEKTQRGAGFEFWLSTAAGTVARWTAGSTDTYNGTVCFQLKLQDGADALPLPARTPLKATVAFRDVETGIVASTTVPVRGTPPKLEGTPPGPDSKVLRDLLSCPRGS